MYYTLSGLFHFVLRFQAPRNEFDCMSRAKYLCGQQNICLSRTKYSSDVGKILCVWQNIFLSCAKYCVCGKNKGSNLGLMQQSSHVLLCRYNNIYYSILINIYIYIILHLYYIILGWCNSLAACCYAAPLQTWIKRKHTSRRQRRQKYITVHFYTLLYMYLFM